MSKMTRFRRFRNEVAYRFVVGLIWFVRRVPRNAGRWFIRGLAGLAFELLTKEREKTLSHLRIAYGDSKSEEEIRRLGKQVFRQLGLNSLDGMRLPIIIKEGLDRYIHVMGKEHLDKAFERGDGVLCITGHIGCWELLATWLAAHYPLKVVGATLYDPRLDDMLLAERRRAGYESLPRDFGGAREIIRWIRRGGMLGILIDQDTRVDGEFVDFFGRQAFTPVGPIYIAQKTGAALVPIAIHMNEDGTHTAEFRPEIPLQETGDKAADTKANLQNCSKAVEQFIREHPSQWVWMHRRWRTRPPDESPEGNA